MGEETLRAGINPGPLSSDTAPRTPSDDAQTTPNEAAATARAAFEARHLSTLRGVPGQTYCIPVRARGIGDTKPERRHALAVSASDVRLGTVVYGSTSKPEQSTQTPYMPVIGTRRGGNGLPADTTYFVASNIIPVGPNALNDKRGDLASVHLDVLRRKLKAALGIGTKTYADAGVAGSWRGRVVRVPKAYGQVHNFGFATVLTEHAHSIAGQYQLLLPMLESDPAWDDPNQDVVVSDNKIVSLLACTAAVWAVPTIISIFTGDPPRRNGSRTPKNVLTDTGLVIPNDLAAVETILTARFELQNIR